MKNHFLGLVNLVLLFSLSEGKLQKFTLTEMVRESDLIVVGTVAKIDTTRIADKAMEVVTIKLDTLLKGDTSLKEIAIHRPITNEVEDEEAEFQIGEQACYFVKKWKNEWQVVQGGNGKVIIKNDNAYPTGIRQQKKEVRAIAFRQQIRKLVGQK
jgi:hypothetical protein